MNADHDDLPEIPDMPEVAPATSPTAPGVPGGSIALSGPPPLRTLDKAPQHLRLAAVIVMAGCVLPWMPGELETTSATWWLWALLGKVVIGSAAWLWLQQVRHDFGPKLGGILGQLAELNPKGKKKDDGKARRAKAAPAMHLEHPFPTGLHLLALVLVIAALVIAYKDPREGLADSPAGIPEVAMFGWAAFTWVHIAGYERWGHFNPLFPLMFLGMLFAGAAAVLGAVTGAEASGLHKLMILAGGGLVAAGGGLAAYTIAEAMMQAKKEGDRKKADALEARKAARQKKA
jgi:hypothetical protein